MGALLLAMGFEIIWDEVVCRVPLDAGMTGMLKRYSEARSSSATDALDEAGTSRMVGRQYPSPEVSAKAVLARPQTKSANPIASTS